MPNLLQLQSIAPPESMHGESLPTLADTVPRDATFSEYGASGPSFTIIDFECYVRPWGRKTLIDSLQWREAAGRCKMVLTREWKYVHDPMGDRGELYDLVNDYWELENVFYQEQKRDVLAQMRLRLADWIIRHEDSPSVPFPEAMHYESV